MRSIRVLMLWRLLGLVLIMLTALDRPSLRLLAGSGNEANAEGAKSASSPSRTPPFIDRAALLPQDEFFLNMLMDRYPAEGGYRVKRFYGSEFFDLQQESALEKRRKNYETALNQQFRDAGFRPTSLPEMQMPLRDVSRKAGGFKTRKEGGFATHMAYDIIAPEGTPVHPVGRGIVVAVEEAWWKKVNHGVPIRIPDRSWWDTAQVEEKPISLKSGNFVVIYHPPAAGKGPGYYSFYAHMADGVPAQPGQIVQPTDTIGLVEHSGYNAMREGHGSHLHISVMKDLGKGYLEPIKFGKYIGLREERPHRRKGKTAAPARKKSSARGKRRG